MDFPPGKETMRSFLGMINYLNIYNALSAHLTAPLSALTHQAVDYKPSKVNYENFNRLKMEVSNMRALPYFDVNAETTFQTDASKKGLGACLIQRGKVICYASRALTKTEQNYQNLEKEALGTIWGMEKFHYFLYWKEFTLETDQKPLVSIYKKHMIDISPRVQRLIARSFWYLSFKVVYKKGAGIPVALMSRRATVVGLEVLGASLGGAATGADLGGSSKYSNEKSISLCGQNSWRPVSRFFLSYRKHVLM